MKWFKLPDKTPPFNTRMLIWIVCGEYHSVTLKSIQENGNGKTFTFAQEDGQLLEDIATHWAIPTKPKE